MYLKYTLLVSFFISIPMNTFSQKKYDFDKPWRAKSNERIYEWYLDHLDDTCDSLLEMSTTYIHETDKFILKLKMKVKTNCQILFMS